MKILVVYDSVFGNTEKLAQAIGAALTEQAEVKVCKVGEVQSEDWQGLDALVAGSPTRAFRPTPAMTEWLGSLPSGSLKGVKALAFDSRIDTQTIKPKLLGKFLNKAGYAGKHMATALTNAGASVAEPLEGFFVLESEGPLKDGELGRVVAWAKGILP